MIKPGDIVGRKSYGSDVLFKVIQILPQGMAALRGLTVRLEATAPLSDLIIISAGEQERFRAKHAALARSKMKSLSGKDLKRQKAPKKGARNTQALLSKGRVLHLDGDADYTQECENFYLGLGLSALCLNIPEVEQPQKASSLCKEFEADVVVLTGHDGRFKGSSQHDDLSVYHHSRAFLEAVKAVRALRPDKDDLAIVAGACQSHYEALMTGGANFASSPGRILIDMFDPCIVAAQIASLGVRNYLEPKSAVLATVGQAQGMGGIETKGKARVFYPASRRGVVKWK